MPDSLLQQKGDLTNQQYDVFTPPLEVKVRPIDGYLQEWQAREQGGTDIGVWYDGGEGSPGILAYESDYLEDPMVNWRVVFTGIDRCWQDYRRDHENTRMLAVNDLPFNLDGPKAWQVLSAETFSAKAVGIRATNGATWAQFGFSNVTDWTHLLLPATKHPYGPGPDAIFFCRDNGVVKLIVVDNKMSMAASASGARSIGIPHGFGNNGWGYWRTHHIKRCIDAVADPILRQELSAALEQGGSRVIRVLTNAGSDARGITAGAKAAQIVFVDCAGIPGGAAVWTEACTEAAEALYSSNGLNAGVKSIAQAYRGVSVIAPADAVALDAANIRIGGQLVRATEIGATAGAKAAPAIMKCLKMCGSIAGKAANALLIAYYIDVYVDNCHYCEHPLTATIVEIANEYMDISEFLLATSNADWDRAFRQNRDWHDNQDIQTTWHRYIDLEREGLMKMLTSQLGIFRFLW